MDTGGGIPGPMKGLGGMGIPPGPILKNSTIFLNVFVIASSFVKIAIRSDDKS